MTTDRTDAPDDVATEFFDRYRRALLDRDEAAVADLYAVPALILFPGQSLPVTSRAQTERFFAASWSQYDGVADMTADLRVVAATAHSVWADVAWRHDGPGEGTERFVYQLVRTDDGWRIAVLTPMDV
ncbi:nuclear transport factor 2 family protein [Isoptericola sp. NPDC019693]|uniref:nuclear transport factor 2 family protein n=1 Tax=Isoptericola sp. NPDC019693 TaxID=3364009 RepID=UPI0037A15DB4